MDLRYSQWIMKAKQTGVCSETRKEINVGDIILYIPGIRNLGVRATVYCKDSEAYKRAEKNVIDTGWKDNLNN